jgi:hypothetical protein
LHTFCYFRDIKKIVLVGLFLVLANSSLQADNIFYKFWQQQLFHYAEQKLPLVAQLSEQEKQVIFKEDAAKSVAILLHEFAQPEGITHRNFDTSHAISKRLLKSPGFKYVMKKLLNSSAYIDTTTQLRVMKNYRYVMTPRKSTTQSIIKQTGFALKEHIRLALRPNISQLFLGSYVVNITQINKEWADVDIYNETGRNSLFLHLPSNTDKPNVFGTVEQRFCLKVRLSEYQ